LISSISEYDDFDTQLVPKPQMKQHMLLQFGEEEEFDE
jgi:hypothetical protein